MIAGKATMYKDKIGGHFVKRNVAEGMLLSNEKKNLLILRHVFVGVRFGEEMDDLLLSFYTTKRETFLGRGLKGIKNIPSSNEDLKYLNPLWFVNLKEMGEFVKIDHTYLDFPENFIKVSEKSKSTLAQLFKNDFIHIWKESLLSSRDPISCELIVNDLNFSNYNNEIAQFKSNKSEIIVASYLGVLNPFHSKIFLGKTRISIEEYDTLYSNINNGLRVEDIIEILK